MLLLIIKIVRIKVSNEGNNDKYLTHFSPSEKHHLWQNTGRISEMFYFRQN
jgi:hypothetical protein